MIVEAADCDRRDAILSRDAGHERPQTRLQLRRNYPGTILCAKNAMHAVGNEGVRHGRHNSMFNRPSGTFGFSSRIPGLRFAASRANYNRASGAGSGSWIRGWMLETAGPS